MLEQLSHREKLIWLAAMIDGEGVVTMSTSNGKHYYPCIEVCNLRDEVHEETCNNFGFRRQSYGHANNSVIFGIRKVVPLLKELLPFLILKGKQAELCMKFADVYSKKPPRKRLPYTDQEKDIITAVRKLNARSTGFWHKPKFR